MAAFSYDKKIRKFLMLTLKWREFYGRIISKKIKKEDSNKMGRVGNCINPRTYRSSIPKIRVDYAQQAVVNMNEKDKRSEAAEKEFKKMEPILGLFRAVYVNKLGEEKTEKIIASLSKFPISRYALIVRLGNELENQGIPKERWEKFALKITGY